MSLLIVSFIQPLPFILILINHRARIVKNFRDKFGAIGGIFPHARRREVPKFAISVMLRGKVSAYHVFERDAMKVETSQHFGHEKDVAFAVDLRVCPPQTLLVDLPEKLNGVLRCQNFVFRISIKIIQANATTVILRMTAFIFIFSI
jgi:hypothetical protein